MNLFDSPFLNQILRLSSSKNPHNANDNQSSERSSLNCWSKNERWVYSPINLCIQFPFIVIHKHKSQREWSSNFDYHLPRCQIYQTTHNVSDRIKIQRWCKTWSAWQVQCDQLLTFFYYQLIRGRTRDGGPGGGIDNKISFIHRRRQIKLCS